jgi:hypothetical protein
MMLRVEAMTESHPRMQRMEKKIIADKFLGFEIGSPS